MCLLGLPTWIQSCSHLGIIRAQGCTHWLVCDATILHPRSSLRRIFATEKTSQAMTTDARSQTAEYRINDFLTSKSNSCAGGKIKRGRTELVAKLAFSIWFLRKITDVLTSCTQTDLPDMMSLCCVVSTAFSYFKRHGGPQGV